MPTSSVSGKTYSFGKKKKKKKRRKARTRAKKTISPKQLLALRKLWLANKNKKSSVSGSKVRKFKKR